MCDTVLILQVIDIFSNETRYFVSTLLLLILCIDTLLCGQYRKFQSAVIHIIIHGVNIHLTKIGNNWA